MCKYVGVYCSSFCITLSRTGAKNINKCNSFECFHYLLDEWMPYAQFMLYCMLLFFFRCMVFLHVVHTVVIASQSISAIIMHGKMHFGAHFSGTTWDRLCFSHLWHGFFKSVENETAWKFGWHIIIVAFDLERVLLSGCTCQPMESKNGNWDQTTFKWMSH